MIFNKVNHHELSRHFFLVSGYVFKCRLTWLVSALFQRVCFCVPSSGLCLQAARTAGFWVSSILGLFYQWLSVFPHPTLPLSFLHWFIQCWQVPGMGAHGWVAGFASHGSGILSRGWLATVEAPGYPRHPPSTLARQQLTHFLPFSSIIMNLWIPGNKVFQKEWPQSLNI